LGIVHIEKGEPNGTNENGQSQEQSANNEWLNGETMGIIEKLRKCRIHSSAYPIFVPAKFEWVHNDHQAVQGQCQNRDLVGSESASQRGANPNTKGMAEMLNGIGQNIEFKSATDSGANA
jgi:hypothetical protein